MVPPVEAVPKFERLMNLVAFLLASPDPVPFSSIRKQVIGYNDPAREDAVEKRFDRDKKELREIGIPVEYVASDEHGRDGYFIPREQYFLRELDLSTDEAALLVLLGNAARGSNDAVSVNLRSALLKLSIDSPLEEDVQAAVSQKQAMAFARGKRDRTALDNLERAAVAIVGRREVRFRYRSVSGGETTQRRVHPYGLGYREGEWYLVGKDLVKEDVRQFKFVRIQGALQPVKSRGRAFQIPDEFDIDAYVERPPWEFPSGREEWASILFGPDVAWMVAEHVRPDQRFESRPDGSGVLSLKVRRSEDTHQRLLTFLAGYSGACAILKPAWLRKQAIDHLRTLRARYD